MKRILQILCVCIYLSAFIIPGYMYFIVNHAGNQLVSSRTIAGGMLILFRLFGLYAFVLVWSQLMLGALKIPLQRLFGSRILKLHLFLGPFTLLFAFTHYMLFTIGNLLTGLGPFEAISSYLGPSVLYGYLGLTAFYLMVLTVISAMLRSRPFVKIYWRKIHYTNYVIFLFAFVHSFFIGTEVQSQPLHSLYYFFAISYLIAVGYQWGYKRILKNNI
jgi:hypothetical protein